MSRKRSAESPFVTMMNMTDVSRETFFVSRNWAKLAELQLDKNSKQKDEQNENRPKGFLPSLRKGRERLFL